LPPAGDDKKGRKYDSSILQATLALS